jgi:hypothetical protein
MTTPHAVWTKTTTPTGTHYRHTNGLTLTEGAGRLWTARNDEGKGHIRNTTSAMRCLASGLDAACLREECNEAREDAMPVHLSVDQFVQAIADLHFGGLP